MTKKSSTPAIRFKGFTDTWEQRKLGEVFNFHYGDGNNNPSNGGQYPVFGAGGIQGRYTKYNAENSIIIGHMGDAGCVSWGEGKHFVTYNGTITTPKDDVFTAKFGYYLLLNMNLRKYRGGSGLPFLTYDMLTEMETKCPNSKIETQEIADYFTQLDHLITLHQCKYDKLTNVKKSMLEKMFPKNGSNVPEIRFKGFTEAWEQRKLGDIVDVCSGRDYKHLSEGDIPVYGTGGYMLSVSEALSYDKDAIGIGRKGTIDKPYILKAPFWTVDTLFYSIPREKIDLNFAFDIFQNIDWKKKDESTGVPSLSKTAINEIDVLVPQYFEQQALGEFFNGIDNLITLHQRELEKLKNLKKACLEKMFV